VCERERERESEKKEEKKFIPRERNIPLTG
jgi:hypothetical protein